MYTSNHFSVIVFPSWGEPFLDGAQPSDTEPLVIEIRLEINKHTRLFPSLCPSWCCVTRVITRDVWLISCVHLNLLMLVNMSYIRINGCQGTYQDHSSGKISLTCSPTHNTHNTEKHRANPRTQTAAKKNSAQSWYLTSDIHRSTHPQHHYSGQIMLPCCLPSETTMSNPKKSRFNNI